MEKLEWWVYQRVKKVRKIFTHFDRIHERDRQTDRWADEQTEGHRMTA